MAISYGPVFNLLLRTHAMTSAVEYSVVVPAFNEEDRLRSPLLDTLEYLRSEADSFELIVVDDGSGDATPQVVHDLQVDHPELSLIRLPANRGKGFAVRTGVMNSRGQYVLFADADGSTPIQEVGSLRARIEVGADVVIGSRAVEGDREVEARLHRKIIGRLFHGCVSLFTVGDFADTQCGFKLLRGNVARDLFSSLTMDGFSFDVELLSMALSRGYRVEEVPVEWSHVEGSRVNLLTDSLRMLRDLAIIRARILRGAYDGQSTPAHDPDAETTPGEKTVKLPQAM